MKLFKDDPNYVPLRSQPARAVWIEITISDVLVCLNEGHSLRGLCGLKSGKIEGSAKVTASQPARAVWIEIQWEEREHNGKKGHSLRGLCGLKSFIAVGILRTPRGHSLRGLCGLKF